MTQNSPTVGNKVSPGPDAAGGRLPSEVDLDPARLAKLNDVGTHLFLHGALRRNRSSRSSTRRCSRACRSAMFPAPWNLKRVFAIYLRAASTA
jgi:hypothetical protein